MTYRNLHLSLSLLLGAASLTLGARAAQTPAPKPPAPPRASIEGVVSRFGTGQPLRETQITLRKAVDPAAPAAQNTGGPAGVDAAQLGALQELFGAFGAMRGGNPARPGATAGTGGPVEASAITDRMGHFVIADLDPGDYIIAAERDGYLRQEYGQRTETTAGVAVSLPGGKRVTINFQLVPAGVISGKVYDTDGSPLADARIQAYTYRYGDGRRSLTPMATIQTNDLGEYRLHPLTAGSYFISVTPRDGLPTDELPGTDTPPGQTRAARDIQAFIARGGAGGGAQEDQAVMLIQAMGLGTPPIYYPGVLDPTEAQPVRVAAAADIRGIDFYLRPIRMVTVKGRVEPPFALPSEQDRQAAIQNLVGNMGRGGGFAAFPGGDGAAGGGVVIGGVTGGAGGRGPAAPTGSPNAGPAGRGNIQDFLGNIQNIQNIQGIIEPIQVKFARIGGESQSPLASLIGNGATPVSADGKFEISNVTPGSYNLTAIAKDQKGVQYTARTRVEIGNANIEGLIIAPKPGIDIKGQVYADSTPPGFKPTQLRVSLVSDDVPDPLAMIAGALGGQVSGGLTAEVQADGTFVLKNVGSLPYRVRVTGLPVGGYVLAGQFGTADPLGATFVANPEKEDLLQLKVGFSAGNVTANIVDTAGKPFPGVLTALVPDEARRGRSDLYFSGTSDGAGRVSILNVPPGSYRIFAWEEIPSGAFKYAEFLHSYEARGVAVTVDNNAAVTVEVKTIPKAEN